MREAWILNATVRQFMPYSAQMEPPVKIAVVVEASTEAGAAQLAYDALRAEGYLDVEIGTGLVLPVAVL